MSNRYIDQRWHDALTEINPVNNTSSILNSTVTALDEVAFLENGTIPSFLYDSQRYTPEVLEGKANQLHALRDQINGEEQNVLIKGAYKERIDELLAANQLILSAITRDWEGFRESNDALWGPYDAVLQAGAGWMLEQVVRNELTSHADPHYEPLLQQLARWKQISNPLKGAIPNEQTFLVAKQNLSQLAIEQNQDTPLTIPLHEVVERSKAILKRCAPSYGVVFIENPVVHFRVSHSKKQLIMCGPRDAKIHSSRFHGLVIGHEIGMHIVRRHNATQGKLGLFVSGGAGSNAVEEGLGVIAEQVQWRSVDRAMQSRRFYIIMARHYAVGMARDGADFTEVYNFYKMIYQLFHKSKPESHAHHYAWKMSASVFRGTPSDRSGTVFMRPSIYLKQTLAVWQALADEPELLNMSVNGKFNVLSKQQTALMKVLINY